MKIASAIFFGLFTLALTFRMFFKEREDFLEAARHCFTPDIISLVKGEYLDDMWNEMKMFFWLGLGALGAYGGYQLFGH